MLAVEVWTDVAVPLLAALIGGLIGGIASYVSSKRSSQYQAKQATNLALAMLRLEREIEALEQLDDALTPLRNRVRQMALDFDRELSTNSQWADDLLEFVPPFMSKLDEVGLRVRTEIRRDVRAFARFWTDQINAASEAFWFPESSDRKVSIDESIEGLAGLTREFGTALDDLRQRMLAISEG